MKVLIKKSFNIDDENDKFFFCENQNPPDILLSMAIGTVQSVNPSQLGLENPYISPHLQILKWDFSETFTLRGKLAWKNLSLIQISGNFGQNLMLLNFNTKTFCKPHKVFSLQ